VQQSNRAIQLRPQRGVTGRLETHRAELFRRATRFVRMLQRRRSRILAESQSESTDGQNMRG
jgi:hypothetical protein